MNNLILLRIIFIFLPKLTILQTNLKCENSFSFLKSSNMYVLSINQSVQKWQCKHVNVLNIYSTVKHWLLVADTTQVLICYVTFRNFSILTLCNTNIHHL